MKTGIIAGTILVFVIFLTHVSYGDITIEELEAKLQTVSGEERAEVLNELSQAYRGKSPEKMLAYGEEALHVATTCNAPKQEANALRNIGAAYYDTREYEKALEYFRQALEKLIVIENKEGMAASLMQLGLVHQKINDYGQALDYYSQALQVYETLGMKAEMISSLNHIGHIYRKLEEYERSFFYLQQALDLAREIMNPKAIQSTYKSLAALYFAKGDLEKGLEYYELSVALYEKMLDEENRLKIAEIQAKYEAERQEQQNEILSQQRRIKILTLKQQIIFISSLIVGCILLAVFAFVLYSWHCQSQKALTIIAKEKAKSEKLLLNVLPIQVAHELEKLGSIKPRTFEHVTVCFVDVVGLSELSASLEPKFLIGELTTIFTAFDEIIEAYECERIKTVGDAYLFVCGMPVENPKHAMNIVRSAYDIVQYLTKRNQYAKTAWQIQVGIHTGKVVGGVVGVKKYAYGVFGETIDMASKIEHSAAPMQINISKMTYELVKDIFHCVEREPLDVKGKGKIKMYSVVELIGGSTTEPETEPTKKFTSEPEMGPTVKLIDDGEGKTRLKIIHSE